MDLEIYKTASRRFFAILIDGLIFLPLMFLESLFTSPEIPSIITIIGLITYYAISHCYSIIFHAYFGQTIGKMIMKVRVFDISGNPTNLKQAFLRDLPILILNIGFLGSEIFQILTVGIDENFQNSYFFWTIIVISLVFVIAEIIVMFSNQHRRTIHDYIAGTVVVKTNLQTT